MSSSSSSSRKRTERDSNDPVDPKKTRNNYRQLTEDLDSNASANEQKLIEYLRQANGLVLNVKETRNATIDSSVVRKISELGSKRAGLLSMSYVEISPSELISHLRTLRPSTAATPAASAVCDWNYLGHISAEFLHYVPPFQFMHGPIHAEVKQRARTTRQVNQVVAPAKETALLGQEAELATSTETSNRVEEIHEIHRATGDINFWKFVIDPESFTQTIENIFHTAFLIQLGKAGTTLADDGQICLQLREEAEASASNECVVKIDHNLWSQIWKIFLEATIPHRDYSGLHRVDDEMAARRQSARR